MISEHIKWNVDTLNNCNGNHVWPKIRTGTTAVDGCNSIWVCNNCLAVKVEIELYRIPFDGTFVKSEGIIEPPAQ